MIPLIAGIAGGVGGLLLLLVILLVILLRRRKKNKQLNQENIELTSRSQLVNSGSMSKHGSVLKSKEEINFEELKLNEQIGTGGLLLNVCIF